MGKEVLAYHEAGHVVVIYELGFSVEYVTLKVTDNYKGEFKINPVHLEETNKWLSENKGELPLKHKEILIKTAKCFIAGSLTEFKKTGLKLKNNDDYIKARRKLNKISKRESHNFFEKLQLITKTEREVKELLKKPKVQRTVEIMAKELLTKETLTHEEAKSIYENEKAKILLN